MRWILAAIIVLTLAAIAWLVLSDRDAAPAAARPTTSPVAVPELVAVADPDAPPPAPAVLPAAPAASTAWTASAAPMVAASAGSVPAAPAPVMTPDRPAEAPPAIEDADTLIADARATAAAQARTAVPRLVAALEANRVRPDGYGPPVRLAIIEALGALGEATAVAPLTRELRAEETPSYHDAVCAALGAIGDPAALPALRARAAALRANEPTEDIARFPWQQQLAATDAAIARCARPRP